MKSAFWAAHFINLIMLSMHVKLLRIEVYHSVIKIKNIFENQFTDRNIDSPNSRVSHTVWLGLAEIKNKITINIFMSAANKSFYQLSLKRSFLTTKMMPQTASHLRRLDAGFHSNLTQL